MMYNGNIVFMHLSSIPLSMQNFGDSISDNLTTCDFILNVQHYVT